MFCTDIFRTCFMKVMVRGTSVCFVCVFCMCVLYVCICIGGYDLPFGDINSSTLFVVPIKRAFFRDE